MATKTRTLSDYLVEGGLSDVRSPEKPHIDPGTLQPAVAGKLLDGSTSHSGAYGTAQADGHKYYYTDIKGSKPIKDPRIGAHFGSQRHKWKSIQLLEQETAIHGEEVYSLDGRENMRACKFPSGSDYMNNDSNGNRLELNRTGSFVEVTGYFNAINLIHSQSENDHRLDILVNGVEAHDNLDLGAAVANPLSSRYVDRGSVRSIDITSSSSLSADTSLAINTVKFLYPTSANNSMYGCELIVQDTGSTVRKNHVNVPAQNVVSYGKKFSIGSDTLTNAVHKHYNPFAFKTDGSTAWASGAHNGTSWPVGTGSSHNIDTATSLGLENWKHSNNYYKPYNGGRVVKWIASDGTIKTSVNMMPPNAQNVGGTAISAKANASVANNTYLPTFSGAIDHSQSEVAKTFHWREFGNGAANGGPEATFADATMLNDADAIAYVMDDGLTSLSADEAQQDTDMLPSNNNKFWFLTFIGTGVTRRAKQHAQVTQNVAQNLPYGTHVLKGHRGSSGTNSNFVVDGVVVGDIADGAYAEINELTVHQPKKPPVPEDACIIADYMLMADFVAESATVTQATISKGVRRISASRDWFYDSANAPTFNHAAHTDRSPDLLAVQTHSSSTMTVTIPTFSTRAIVQVEDIDQADHGTTWAGTDTESSNTKVQGTNNSNDIAITPAVTLGVNTIVQTVKSGGHQFCGGWVASPIHTSSHYQTFETPFLHELVGGDRNMEQNNLIITADGKSWDEVTRDTSYIGTSSGFLGARDGGNISAGAIFYCDHWRGRIDFFDPVQKDFAPAYDKVICLKDGWYTIFVELVSAAGADSDIAWYLYINGVTTNAGSACGDDTRASQAGFTVPRFLKRGDLLHCLSVVGGLYGGDVNYSNFGATRINR